MSVGIVAAGMKTNKGISKRVCLCVHLQYISLGKMKGSSRDVDAFSSLHLE